MFSVCLLIAFSSTLRTSSTVRKDSEFLRVGDFLFARLKAVKLLAVPETQGPRSTDLKVELSLQLLFDSTHRGLERFLMGWQDKMAMVVICRAQFVERAD